MNSSTNPTDAPDDPTQGGLLSRMRLASLVYVSAVVLAVLIGLWLRFDHLTQPTVGHSEIYIPGIDLPAGGISHPPPRHTVQKVILSTIHGEPHPPGYYVVMLAWTKVFGTGVFAMRLPNVLLSAATITLLIILGRQLGFPAAGVIAAILWATSPQSVYLDRIARMYPMVCCLGLLSTVLLVETYRARSHRLLFLAAYLLTCAAGLSMTVYAWPILLAHLLFAILGPSQRAGYAPPQASWLLGLVAFCSPLISIAAYQSGRPSYLNPAVLAELSSYLQLCYVFPHEPGSGPFSPWNGWGIGLLGLVVILLLVGVVRARTRGEPSPTAFSPIPAPPTHWIYGGSGIALLAIAVFAYASTKFEHFWEDRTEWVAATGCLPLVVVGLEHWMRSRWTRLRRMLDSLTGGLLSLQWLLILTAIVPVAFVCVVSAVGRPLMAARTVYPYAPYLFLLVAAGATYLGGRRVATALALTVLLAANGAGFYGYRQRFAPPIDYKALARQVEPVADDSDLWFVFQHWTVTPIFYYLTADRQFVGGEYAEARTTHPGSRIWVIRPAGIDTPDGLAESLRSCRLIRHFRARGISAQLYEQVTRPMQDVATARLPRPEVQPRESTHPDFQRAYRP